MHKTVTEQIFFRRQEAADFIRVSLATIDRMAAIGDLPKIFVRPRVPLFRRRDLLRIANKG